MRESLTLSSIAAERTAAIGAALGRLLMSTNAESPVVVFLRGELGAGKTTFVGGLLHDLGVKGPVRSPTYTLIEPYEVCGKTFYHLDLYRLTDPMELEPLGIPELLSPGAVLLIEWPEQGGALLPSADLIVDFRYPASSQGREIHLLPKTKLGTQLAIALQSSTAQR